MNAPPHETTVLNELAPGIAVSDVVQAATVGQVSDVLRTSSEAGDPVIPFGGRHSLATGNPVGPARLGLDLTGLTGLLAYEPADLTVSVRAGTTVAEIQAELNSQGQEIPVDVPHPETTTIGGLVATGFAGPRRLRSGSLRDLLIGCTYVRGDGLVAKAGGMVVKNVSGFEIPRFLHGSWGALAVMTSVNLKVTPRPRADGTVIAEFDDFGRAIESSLRLIASEPSIEACVVDRMVDGVRVVARAVGRAAAVEETLSSFANVPGSVSERLEHGTSSRFWQEHTNAFSEAPGSLVMAMSVRSREIAALAVGIEADVFEHSDARIAISPGFGSLRLTVPNPTQEAAGLLTVLSRKATELGAAYVLESAPPHLRTVIAAWGPHPDGIELMRSVKKQFDPAGILNRGRLLI